MRKRNRITKNDDSETMAKKLKGRMAAYARNKYGKKAHEIAPAVALSMAWAKIESRLQQQKGAKILPDQGIVRKILSPAAFDVSKPNGARIRIKKEEAETELYQLAAHKRVRWEPVKTETSGRIIAIVWADMAPGAISLNAEMVRAGLLMVNDPKEAGREICNRWRVLQKTAEINKMGMHVDES